MKETTFLRALNSRCRQHLARRKEGALNEGYIALDLLASIYSAHAGGLPPEKVTAALPVAAWRENTVSVPADFLEILAGAWRAYLAEQDTPRGKTLGQCLGVEPTEEGHKSRAKLQRTADKRQGYANQVSKMLLLAELDGTPMKQTAAIALVAERAGVSESTVRNAWRELGRPNMEAYRKEAKTVRS